jgi:hypothetical protein
MNLARFLLRNRGVSRRGTGGYATALEEAAQMSKDEKPKVSADGTYIFDADDLDELDDVSLTSVMGDVAESIKEKLKESGDSLPDIDESIFSTDEDDARPGGEQEDLIATGIEATRSPDAMSNEADADTGEEDEPETLIPPELLFPGASTGRGGKGS